MSTSPDPNDIPTPRTIITTPANVARYEARGYTRVSTFPGIFGEELVSMTIEADLDPKYKPSRDDKRPHSTED